jgi:Rrf2 family transcriptional regulator, iron-sulfur cluster assembly transcription factor
VKLQAKTRYGVQAVFDIAFQMAGNPTQAKDIARREGIPLRYLEQIFQDLKRAGLVDSRRGPRGGYYLRKPPEQIRLGDIVRALQGPIDELFAPDEESSTAANDARPARSHLVTSSVWRELAEHVTRWFDEISVADLVKRGGELGVQRGDKRAPMYFI